MIIGIAAAADYLGYGKPALEPQSPAKPAPPTADPPGPHAALREWHSKLKIAGNRAYTPGPD
jgi:hypothetical protein